jgi:hypothetical protein
MKKGAAATVFPRDPEGVHRDPAGHELPSILSQVLASTGPGVLSGARTGTLAGFGSAGQCLVEFPENTAPGPVPARTIVPLWAGDLGRELLLVFEREDPSKPIVLGLIQPVGQTGSPQPSGSPSPPEAIDAEIDGTTVRLTARAQIVLRCGEASITLTRAGKIMINGTYVMSRSSGANKIKGGSIELN